ncbi:MAG: P-loop NTPase [Candidatus Micrarchaeaceae archaeon]
MSSPYMLRISSQKGGVGKTTVATNLASIIRLMGYKVLLIDGDFVNPSVGFHLGLEDINVGVRAVFKRKAKLENAVAIHDPTGLHVLAGEISNRSFEPGDAEQNYVANLLHGTSYNFVIVDTSPGYTPEALLRHYDESIIVTTPEMSACTSAIRLANIYDKMHLKHSLVINRVRNTRYEMHTREIEQMYGGEVAGVLPEDDIVPISIAEHIPAYVLNKKAKFSRAVLDTAHKYARRSEAEPEYKPKRGFWARLFGR